MDTEALKKSLVTKFVELTHDRLQKVQLAAINLEKDGADKAADEMARELHTMKGEARMLGLLAVGQLAHAMEDLLRSHREGKVPVKSATDWILRACDVLSDLMDNVDAAQKGGEESAQVAQGLATASGHALPPLQPRPSPALGAPTRAAKAKPLPKAPTSRPVDTQEREPAKPPTAKSKTPAVAVDEGSDRRSKEDRSIRVNVDVLDSMGLLAGDLLVESARNRLRGDALSELLGRFSRVGDQFLKMHRPQVAGEGATATAFEQIESDLLLLRDDAFRFMRQNADGLDALHGNLSQLANQVAEARLVPLSTVVEAFPRAVRELAHEQGKQIDLSIENSGVGVDRSMLADVRDALIHLVRNAIDHGIESAGVRQTLGKPDEGKLAIRLRSDGDMLAVELADDGRGIDPEKLKEVAVTRKVLTRAQATALSEREALDLIFRAGFSTREEVSDVSGRGVGMDVVKQKIESLGGSVTVQSRVGRGTTVSLRLPQSLAMMRVLLIRLGEDVYGVPAADVEAVARFKPEDRMEVFGTLAVMHRGRPTAFVALGPLLGLNGGPRFERPPAIIVRHGPDRAALAVDGFVHEREVAVKPCGGELLKGAPFIAGTAALEDGRIAVLLHVPDIMAEVRKLTRPTAEATASRRLRVLLVDDSPIARATEGALVKALGHHVDEAQDGEEAWARIQKHPYDIILTDVQMPKLDGFALTKRIKTHVDLAALPVIILSSLASPEDRRRGVDAGANGYLIKGELGVESLALAIERLS